MEQHSLWLIPRGLEGWVLLVVWGGMGVPIIQVLLAVVGWVVQWGLLGRPQ